MPAAKQQPSQPSSVPAEPEESAFSFIPSGIPRSIAEYLTATVPGAILLFAFFVAVEIALIITKNDLLSTAFLPVVCIMPVLAGVVSTLVLEKVRKKPITFKRGAAVGALAGFFGAVFSSLMIDAINIFMPDQNPLGAMVGKSWIVYVATIAIIGMGTILGALGGAIVIKFTREP